MAILHQAPAGRWRRYAGLTGMGVSAGVALAWLMGVGTPAPRAAMPLKVVTTTTAAPMRSAPAADSGCDARCAIAGVMQPASMACAAVIEDLAGFGVRWLVEGPASARFDRVAWLRAARGTVTLGGARAEFRNAAGAALPVDYECDVDLASLAVIAARARPGAGTAVAAGDLR